MAAWRKGGFEGHVAINLSPVLFQRFDLLDRLLEHFRFSNMSLENVHFEVTETGIMEQPNRGANILGEIRERGSRISIDDFGTGHSSLAYLADLPIDSIKIDKHFVQNLDRPWGEAVVGAACTLAQKLGLVTIAEGIEDEATLRKARQLGCDFAQGFFIGRPMFKEKFEKWLGF
jgi:EAL domain-containing protein (putative c-di-GMP-specific phosphodiesterase class I)